jgi:thioesterase domain-containing protein
LVRLRQPEESERFYVHPSVLDAALRLVDRVAAAPSGSSWEVERIDTVEVTAIERGAASISSSSTDTLWVHGRVVAEHSNVFIVNLSLFRLTEGAGNASFVRMTGVRYTTSKKSEKADQLSLHRSKAGPESTVSLEQLRNDFFELASMHSSVSFQQILGSETLQDLGLSSLAIIGLRNAFLDRHGVFLRNDFILAGATVDELVIIAHTAISSGGLQGGPPRAFDLESNHKDLPLGFMALNELAGISLRKAKMPLPPLFLFHDVTGQVRHLETVAGLLSSVACFGVRYDANTSEAGAIYDSVSDLGVAYAQRILSMPGMRASSIIRVGGYSYGCRVAYAAAEYLEKEGFNVELVLLDGPIDGPIHREVSEIIKFSFELYLQANVLQGAFHDEADSIVDIFKEMGAVAVAEDRIRLERIVGHAHVEPLLRHVRTITRLASLTSSFCASYCLRGRTLRITSESTTEPDRQASALISNLTLATAQGSHFEFFRTDAHNVAAIINRFLTPVFPSSTGSLSFSNRSNQIAVWYEPPDGMSKSGLRVGINGVFRMEWDCSVVVGDIDLATWLLITDSTISCTSRSDSIRNPLSGSVTVIWEGVRPVAGERVGTWLNAQLARVPDDADFLRYDREASELSFRVEKFCEFPLPSCKDS